MTSHLILTWFPTLRRPNQAVFLRKWCEKWRYAPRYVQKSPVASYYHDLLGMLEWKTFPERNLAETRGTSPVSYAAFAAANLIKIDRGFTHMSQLRRFLIEHPDLSRFLGFNPHASKRRSRSGSISIPLPTHRHFTRMLRTIPNAALQTLLDSSVRLLQTELAEHDFGECVSIDTKHILAWVKENNPKAYIKQDRFNKEKQPPGDPDCKLGCKRRSNQSVSSKKKNNRTPCNNPVPADTVSVGEYYWGYASGIAATKVPDWGEFVLAELTQTFDKSDVSYFFPLMDDVERRLGFRPKYGAFDAAFDAFYVYEHFNNGDGFAAVPFSEKGGYKAGERTFTDEGLPHCKAGLPMPLKFTYLDRTITLVTHERGKYVCPLLHPQPSGDTCPINHERWAKGGCTAMMPTAAGARIRYTLDRDSDDYKRIYSQRTATERINSQAKALGIERPHLRNGQAIANLNTLIYTLINLRALQRVRKKKSRSQV